MGETLEDRLMQEDDEVLKQIGTLLSKINKKIGELEGGAK